MTAWRFWMSPKRGMLQTYLSHTSLYKDLYKERTRYSGMVVVTGQKEVIWVQALSKGTSVQRAGITALTQALKCAKGRKMNIYTDSRYAFDTAHVHGQIYKQRGLLNSERKAIKSKYEIV